MTLSIGISRLLLSINQLHIVLSTFSWFPQRVFFLEEFISFFSNEAVNLCLLLTHVETVLRGTPYFTATSLFGIAFSKSIKALLLSAKDLFVSFRLTGAIFRKKISEECYFIYNNRINLWNFQTFECRNVMTKVQDNERNSSSDHKLLFELRRYFSYREFFVEYSG